MALVLRYFSPLTSLIQLATSCNLWPTVPAPSLPLSNDMLRLKRKLSPSSMPFTSLTNSFLASWTSLFTVTTSRLRSFSNASLASAPRRLQSMMLTLQRYTFQVEYRKGSSLHIADTLSRAPLPVTSHKPVCDELVYHLDFENDTPDLSGLQDAMFQDIKTSASTDPEQAMLHSLIESGWPPDKAAVPTLARPYWSFRQELTSHDGLLFKQDRVIIPLSLRHTMLHKLHSAHRGIEFTQRHARNCVFWPGINDQIKDMCQACVTCAQYTHQHLKGLVYLVTVDHYSDFYELDQLPTIQSSAVIQATKQHFGRHGIPHTLITDNGGQYTSDLFKTFADKYKFHHLMSSPYWSQSNGRAEVAVKSAKHILLSADDIDLALLSVRNTAPAGHSFSPAQRLFGRALRTDLPQPAATLQPVTPPCDSVVKELTHQKEQQKRAYDKRAGPPLPALTPGSYVYAKPPPTSTVKAWIPGQVVGPAGPQSYTIKTGSRVIRRNCTQIHQAPPSCTSVHDMHPKPKPVLPDQILPNELTANTPPSHATLRPTVTPSSDLKSMIPMTQPPFITPVTPPANQTTSTPPLFPSSLATRSPSFPTASASKTTTCSGRVIRRPARYTD